MEPAITSESASRGTFEVRGMTPGDRAAGIVVIVAAAALFAILGFTQNSHGHEIGYLMSAGCVWWALYYAFVPSVKVVVEPDGMEFVDMSVAAFFLFPRRRVAWRDVAGIVTRTVQRRYGYSIQTEITVRISDVPLELRRFSVLSRDSGYDGLLARLKANVNPSVVTGLGVDPNTIHAASSDMLRTRLRLLGALTIGAIGSVALAWLLRH